jgi:hypothetical protein
MIIHPLMDNIGSLSYRGKIRHLLLFLILSIRVFNILL